jgi:hypothetical protein
VEPTLAITMTELQDAVADYLGWDRDSDNWSASQTRKMAEYLKSGLRNFYYPTVMDGVLYEWSFLKPSREVTIPSGSRAALMPPDYGGVEGTIVVTSGDDGYYRPVEAWNEGKIDAWYAGNADASGAPQAVTIRPRRDMTADRGQRWELYVYPEADREYTFRMTYSLHPDALSEKAPYAYGGPAHAETVLESCLCVAEQREDDTMGVHTSKFRERLAASINHDRKMKPRQLGCNSDTSDQSGVLRRRAGRQLTFTLNGTQLF